MSKHVKKTEKKPTSLKKLIDGSIFIGAALGDMIESLLKDLTKNFDACSTRDKVLIVITFIVIYYVVHKIIKSEAVNKLKNRAKKFVRTTYKKLCVYGKEFFSKFKKKVKKTGKNKQRQEKI